MKKYAKWATILAVAIVGGSIVVTGSNAVADANAATSKTQAWLCTFERGSADGAGLIFRLTGRDLSPDICRAFNARFQGRPRYGVRGHPVAAWRNKTLNIYATIWASNARWGDVYSGWFRDGWIRLRTP